jgi:hypothetical protein
MVHAVLLFCWFQKHFLVLDRAFVHAWMCFQNKLVMRLKVCMTRQTYRFFCDLFEPADGFTPSRVNGAPLSFTRDCTGDGPPGRSLEIGSDFFGLRLLTPLRPIVLLVFISWN